MDMSKKLVVVLCACVSCLFSENKGASVVSLKMNVDQVPINLTEIKNLDLLEIQDDPLAVLVFNQVPQLLAYVLNL